MLTLAYTVPNWAIGIGVSLFVVVSAMLILVVLVQKPQGGGLSEAFGASGGSGNTAFGAKTGDALTTATIGMFVVFILGAIALNYGVRPPEAVDAAEIGADPQAPVTTTIPATPTTSTTTTTSTSTAPMGSVEVVPSQPAPAATTPAPAPTPAPAEQPKNPQ
jgi:preprotein translocase subunit SecG